MPSTFVACVRTTFVAVSTADDAALGSLRRLSVRLNLGCHDLTLEEIS
jgi:hypothetical protein